MCEYEREPIRQKHVDRVLYRGCSVHLPAPSSTSRCMANLYGQANQIFSGPTISVDDLKLILLITDDKCS